MLDVGRRAVLLALDARQPRASQAILAVEIDAILPLTKPAVELDAVVLPSSTEERQSEILEIVIPLRLRNLLARRVAHVGSFSRRCREL